MNTASRGSIYRAALGRSPVSADTVLANLSYPVDLAIDVDAGYIYWTEFYGLKIRRANLDVTSVRTLVDTRPLRPSQLALDLVRGKLYWTADADYPSTSGGIYRSNLNGTQVEVVIAGFTGAIAVDTANGKIYWVEHVEGVGRVIRRADLDGSGVEDLLVAEGAHALAVDPSSGRLYWGDRYGIKRLSVDGSGLETIVERASPAAIAFDTEVGKMFWTVSHSNTTTTIRRANLDGSEVENLIPSRVGSRSGWGLALDPRCGAPGPDCQGSGLPDACDIARGGSRDCDATAIPDECEIADGLSTDCNENGIPDQCEPDEDCNTNGVQDICDLADGFSDDCNGNAVPDDCEVDEDCNGNGVQDICDIANQASPDCDENGTPDDCQFYCSEHVPSDKCLLECNGNGVPDDCDIAVGTSQDCNRNMIPDECDLDCNGNGLPDDCDIENGTSLDDDGGGIPDECEAFAGCLTGPEYFDYTPHRTSAEAEHLAMTLTGGLRATNEEYNRLLRDLHLARLSIPELSGIPYRVGEFSSNRLFVRLDTGMPHSGYDQLNTFYQVVNDHEYHLVDGLHILTFCDSINAEVLQYEYEELPEVIYGCPDFFLGDGSSVTAERLESGAFQYTFVRGWGDCPAGCMCHTITVVDVSALGGVSLVSYEEHGDCGYCDLCEDCNMNGIDDPCDIACGPPLGDCDVLRCGQSADCNGNGIPDECDLRGDINEDGSVGIDDHAAFIAVHEGPAANIPCSMADLHRDSHVDLRDYATFQVVFGG